MSVQNWVKPYKKEKITVGIRTEKTVVKCRECGTTFYYFRSTGAGANRKYCGPVCRRKVRARYHKDYDMRPEQRQRRIDNNRAVYAAARKFREGGTG